MRGEEDAALVGEVPVVFEADAERILIADGAGQVDAGFVGEAHAGLEQCGVAADEVGPLVAIHADAVAEAMGEDAVAGAEAGGGDDLAGGGVDGLGLDAGAGGGEGGGLGAVDDVEDVALALGGLAVDEAAGDVGLVALDGAAVVDEDDLAFANDLRLQAAVGQGGGGANLAGGVALDAGAGVAFGDKGGEVVTGDAGPGRFPGGFVDCEGDGVGELHEGELGGRLDLTAAGDDGDGGVELAPGVSFGERVGEDELDAFVDTYGAGSGQVLDEQAVGVFVLLPGEDFGGAAIGELGELLGHAGFLEAGADNVGRELGVGGEYPGEQALGLAGVDAGEVDERRAAGEDDGGHALLLHEGAGFVGAGLALGEGDGNGLVGAVG